MDGDVSAVVWVSSFRVVRFWTLGYCRLHLIAMPLDPLSKGLACEGRWGWWFRQVSALCNTESRCSPRGIMKLEGSLEWFR